MGKFRTKGQSTGRENIDEVRENRYPVCERFLLNKDWFFCLIDAEKNEGRRDHRGFVRKGAYARMSGGCCSSDKAGIQLIEVGCIAAPKSERSEVSGFRIVYSLPGECKQ